MVPIGLKVERSTGSNAKAPKLLLISCSGRIPGAEPGISFRRFTARSDKNKHANASTRRGKPERRKLNERFLFSCVSRRGLAYPGDEERAEKFYECVRQIGNAAVRSGFLLFPVPSGAAASTTQLRLLFSALFTPPPHHHHPLHTIKLQPRYDGWDVKQGAVKHVAAAPSAEINREGHTSCVWN